MPTMLVDGGNGSAACNHLNYHMNSSVSAPSATAAAKDPLQCNPGECVVTRPPVILRGPIVPLPPRPHPLLRPPIPTTTPAPSSDIIHHPHPSSSSNNHLSICIRFLHILLSLPHQQRYSIQDLKALTITMVTIRLSPHFSQGQFSSTEDLAMNMATNNSALIDYCGQSQLLSAASNFRLLIQKILPTIFEIPSSTSTTTGTTSSDPRMKSLKPLAGDLADIFFQIEVRHPVTTEHFHNNNIFEVTFHFQWYTTGFLGRGLPRELYTTGTLKTKFRDLLIVSAELHLDFDTLFNNVKFMNAL